MTLTREDVALQREVALVDLVDRLLAGGVATSKGVPDERARSTALC